MVNPAVVVGQEDPEDMEEGAVGAETGEGGAGEKLSRVAADYVTKIGIENRIRLRAGIVSRFVGPRYLSTGDGSKASYVFAVLWHPLYTGLRCVELLSDNPEFTAVVKERIKRVVLDMLEDLRFTLESRERRRGRGRSSSSSSA